MADGALTIPDLEADLSVARTGRRRLNAADRAMWAVDSTLRRLGAPGFETQTFVWLGSRIDAARLRIGLECLSSHSPVAVARLVEDLESGGPCWQFRPDATCVLHEATLTSPSPQAVLDHAGKLLSHRSDPAEEAPIHFHLLHRPDGRDVFIVQHNHKLMDYSDTVRLLRLIDRLWEAPAHEPSQQAPTRQDPVRGYLRRIPQARRQAAFRRVAELPGQLRGGAIQLGRAPGGPSGSYQLRIATRRVESVCASALQARIVETCGVPNMSMAVLASAFRAIAQLAGQRGARGRYYCAAIGLDLGLPRGLEPVWQNLVSLMLLQIAPADLEDRDALLRSLTRQLRELLTSEADVGMLRLASIFGRRQHQARWAIELVLRYCLSLWFAYFGTPVEVGEHFCGAAVEEVFSAGPSWSPVGLTLLVNQFRGRLHFQVTHVPECVPEPLANEFLDRLLDDLIK